MLALKGFQKTSMIDYPGKMCSIIFLGDCNFRCPFCQNPDLIMNSHLLPTISHEEIFSYLKSKCKWIDGVCVTGGEPTLHKGLPDFLRKLKSIGLLVKLDTNGTNPHMVANLLKLGLVDYIAMDIKGPIDRYDEIAQVEVNKDDIQKSVELVRAGGIDYEFRTTIVPKLLRKADLISIGEWLKGSKKYALQQFRPMYTLDKSYESEPAYSEADIRKFAAALSPYFESVEVRV